VLSPCRLKGVSEEVQCGTLTVFEDRLAQRGPKIRLNVAVVPALTASPEVDPLFILAGGPGQAATEHVRDLLPVFERLHRSREIVFVDQRGTGKSGPLECEEAEDAGISEQFNEDADTASFAHCLARLTDGGARPPLYTTPLAMDDLDDVRAALGYERINLWGASYGTRAALVYLRQHPERVRSAVLDGVFPTTMSLPGSAAEDGQRAFDLIFQSCAGDPACNRAFPHLEARFQQLLTRLDQGPVRAHVTHPLTGRPVELALTRRGFLMNLHGILYLPELASLLPLIIDRASEGDFQPYVAQALGAVGGMMGGISQGLFFSVICSEDMAAAGKGQRTPDYFGDALEHNVEQICSFWPKGELPAGYHSTVQSTAPVLLLSGELDPVTPPRHAEEAKAGLTRATHLVVPGVGHGVTPQGCVPKLIAQFIDSQGQQPLATECLKSLKRPPFFVDFSGPTP
jgi:pimeloyl-ACP methyl ester carboxylesterase